jgi:hypothetical protein
MIFQSLKPYHKVIGFLSQRSYRKKKECNIEGVIVMVFNTTFNNISVISWQSVLLVKETGVPGENHQPVASN